MLAGFLIAAGWTSTICWLFQSTAGFEILWYRVISLVAGDKVPMLLFSPFLGIYLVASGCFAGRRLADAMQHSLLVRIDIFYDRRFVNMVPALRVMSMALLAAACERLISELVADGFDGHFSFLLTYFLIPFGIVANGTVFRFVLWNLPEINRWP